MPVPLLDLTRQYQTIKPSLDKAVSNALAGCAYILGPEVARLEEEVADLCGVKYAIGVASGTDALLLALAAVGVGRDDEVITTDFSFFSTASVITRLGARPALVDIEEDTYNIDPARIEAAITPRTKAIMPVHLFGQVADMDPICEVAARHNLPVIEDAAQAIGAEYRGKRAGSIGDIGCFSFYPTKNLGAAGDAGMIVTDDEATRERCRMLRVHGQSGKYRHRVIGFNSRLDSLQAAILRVKLPHLREWSEMRRANAARYGEALRDVPDLRTPTVKEYSTFHIYNQYTLATPHREKVLAGLDEAGIGYCVYYPVPFHLQECFAYLGHRPDEFEISTRAAGQVFSIPIFPELTAEEQAEVISVLKRLLS
jgi:dTDP-4-amino-4,6-dideoxygalactose transaminase